MKKVLSLVAAISFAIVLISSCQKDNVTVNNSSNEVKSNSLAEKTGGLKSTGFEGGYNLSSVVGHSSTDCGNACIMINGIPGHIDCQYWGSKCSFTANVNVIKTNPRNPSDPYYFATGTSAYQPTDDSIFFMPNRSFMIKNGNYINGYIWLNIPEQKLVRNSTNNLFTYYNITFTTNQLFINR